MKYLFSPTTSARRGRRSYLVTAVERGNLSRKTVQKASQLKVMTESPGLLAHLENCLAMIKLMLNRKK